MQESNLPDPKILENTFCVKKDKRKKRSERNNNTLWDFDISVPPL